MYDYIIVGAGSAGCVLANRLTENSKINVLLLEAGKPDRSLKINIPAAASQLFKTEYDWAYYTEPEPNLNNRKLFIPRGKGLGGSSSINAMIYIRGHRKDYDHWYELGNEGWSFAEVLPYFKKAEHQELGASEYHGVHGPLRVSNRRYTNLLSYTFIKSAKEIGLPLTSDLNEPEPEGIGLYQVNHKNGQRCSAAAAYIKPIINRPNLTIRTQSQVTRIILEGTRAIGVEYLQDCREIHQAKTCKEVILCGGAINSPHLLLLSGIGNNHNLQDLGIQVVANLPGVGQNLQEHLGIGLFYECRQPITLDQANNVSNLLKYLLFKKGPLTSNVAEAGGFVKTKPELEIPDLQFHFAPAYFVDHGFIKPKGYGFGLGATQLRPLSRGKICLRSPDISTAPIIEPNYLSHQADIDTLVMGLQLGRKILQSSAFAPFRGVEFLPGSQVQETEEITAYIRDYVQTLYHPVGTCKMGSDPMAVVNSRLQVYGVQGLRVVDASVMPTIVGGNTHAPTVMIAEKAADWLKEEC